MSCAEFFQLSATIVADEFIEKYMPEANGDYVKVYLYLLKNRAEGLDIARTAESLHLTEGDVRRAVRYWEDKGIMFSRSAMPSSAAEGLAGASTVSGGTGSPLCMQQGTVMSETGAAASEAGTAVSEAGAAVSEASPDPARDGASSAGKAAAAAAGTHTALDGDTCSKEAGSSGPAAVPAAGRSMDELRNHYRKTEGRAILGRLGHDDEFVQLLFIVQKYRSKILTESEQEVIAYLYDGLGLPCEVIDYLVAYCVETGHNSMRYIERTGLDWSEAGIRDAKSARRRTEEFEKQKSMRTAKTQSRRSRQGITRGTNLDDLVKTKVLKSM